MASAGPTYLAVDFGASSGRVIASTRLTSREISTTEVYRFPNSPVSRGGFLRWDMRRLFKEFEKGLSAAASSFSDIRSIGIDTWGVDFGLIDTEGNLTEDPFCYRETAWEEMVEDTARSFGAERLYGVNGLQPLAINSIYRLIWMKRNGLDFAGKRLLFMPDMFVSHLTGRCSNEYTIASTSGLLNAATKEWSPELIKYVGLPPELMCDIVFPGADMGKILPEIAQRTGLSPDVRVTAVAAHDTACAVAAVDFAPGTAFLSSGTWSLLGIESPAPVLTDKALAHGYSNEGGTDGILFLQNITGLWILQQLAEGWKREGKPHDYPTLTRLAEEACSTGIIDVDDHVFAGTSDMAANMTDWCRSHNVAVPTTQGEFVRLVLESLAQRYKKGIRAMETVSGRKIERLCVIGGGSKNQLLNRLTAEATGLQTFTGPAEATALGNLKIQMSAFH